VACCWCTLPQIAAAPGALVKTYHLQIGWKLLFWIEDCRIFYSHMGGITNSHLLGGASARKPRCPRNCKAMAAEASRLKTSLMQDE